MSLLKVSGTKIVDEQDRETVLRGAGLGGWMKYVISLFSPYHLINISYSMENFITGYPGCEHQIREALKEAIGEKKQALFFDKVRFSNVCFDSLI